MTKMTSKGQVVIPQGIRAEAGISDGEKFFVYTSDDSIVLKRAKKLEDSESMEEFERVFDSLYKTAKARGITREDVKEAIKYVRRKKRLRL